MRSHYDHRRGAASRPLSRSWIDAEQAAAHLTDRLGKPLDPRIRQAVVALRAHRFDTTGSCQGHLGHGESAPWIDVAIVSPVTAARLRKRPGAIARLRRDNLRSQQRLLAALDRFYDVHRSNSEARLILIPFGIYGGFRLTNQASEIQRIMPPTSRRRALADFQAEFRAFATFLESTASDKRSNQNRRRKGTRASKLGGSIATEATAAVLRSPGSFVLSRS